MDNFRSRFKKSPALVPDFFLLSISTGLRCRLVGYLNLDEL